MNDYQYRVQQCIDDKLIDFAMTEAKSLYNIDILYHHYILEVSSLFNNPNDHLTKIMKIAYDKTIKEYSQ